MTKVLVIDDDLDVQEIIKTVLETEDFEVTGCFNAIEGIRTALKDPPDIILLDVMMAGTDGFEACRSFKAKEITKNIPIVMISAKIEPRSQKLAKELGASSYITKPFDPLTLGETLLRVIENNK